MSGRETKNIFYYLKNKDYIRVWRLLRCFDKLTYEDTFMPLICKVKDHKYYQPEPEINPEEWACKRCHKFVSNTLEDRRLRKLKKLNKL